MKKIIKKIVKIIIIILPLVILISLFGSPWGMLIANYKIEKYLNNNFSTKMHINKIVYNLYTNNYFAKVQVKDNPNIDFLVCIGGYTWPSGNRNEIMDTYCTNYWPYQAKTMLFEKSDGLIDNFDNIRVRISNDRFLLKEYGHYYDKLPNYDEVKDELATELNLSFTFDKEFSKNDKNEYIKLFKIIKVIKEYIPTNIISFYYNDDYFQIDNEKNIELENIKEPNDLERYFKFR